MLANDALKGRVALVAGAGSGGIGLPTALGLARAGASIVAIDKDRLLLDETMKCLEGFDIELLAIEADLHDRRQVKNIMPQVEDRFGHVDLVANIAGGSVQKDYSRIERMADDMYDRTFALNCDYAVKLSADAAALMMKNGTSGAIVNVASVAGQVSAPFQAPYGAAKAALMSFTRTMAVEWGGAGIRANCVAPGSTRTARAEAIAGPAMAERAKVWAPLGRSVEVEDIANAIIFLLSDFSRGITGQTLTVDCGVMVRSPFGSLDLWESRLPESAR
jgi:NAD(P)-dependent dehydrogenase (short-subunit alcohol dehydrogenase family)